MICQDQFPGEKEMQPSDINYSICTVLYSVHIKEAPDQFTGPAVLYEDDF